jgi:hypothetical protein
VADCVISSILDTDLNRMVPACIVHASYAPCHRNGEPACATPLHTYPQPSRDAAVAFWQHRTHEQRALVIHRDTPGAEHDTTESGAACWCGPEVLGGDRD